MLCCAAAAAPGVLTVAAQSERILRSQVLHLQQQVNELNAKQVDLLGQKQQLQVGEMRASRALSAPLPPGYGRAQLLQPAGC